jgi:hypothetical protein
MELSPQRPAQLALVAVWRQGQPCGRLQSALVAPAREGGRGTVMLLPPRLFPLYLLVPRDLDPEQLMRALEWLYRSRTYGNSSPTIVPPVLEGPNVNAALRVEWQQGEVIASVDDAPGAPYPAAVVAKGQTVVRVLGVHHAAVLTLMQALLPSRDHTLFIDRHTRPEVRVLSGPQHHYVEPLCPPGQADAVAAQLLLADVPRSGALLQTVALGDVSPQEELVTLHCACVPSSAGLLCRTPPNLGVTMLAASDGPAAAGAPYRIAQFREWQARFGIAGAAVSSADATAPPVLSPKKRKRVEERNLMPLPKRPAAYASLVQRSKQAAFESALRAPAGEEALRILYDDALLVAWLERAAAQQRRFVRPADALSPTARAFLQERVREWKGREGMHEWCRVGEKLLS